MAFLEIEKSVRTENWSMQDLHSHAHYEIYLLSKGKRSFFLSNALYKVSAPVVIIIPPHVMHKTEGGEFERYNANVSTDYLNPYQEETLNAHALQFLKLTPLQTETLKDVFEQAIAIDKREKHATQILHALFSYAVFLLNSFEKSTLSPSIARPKEIPALVLKTIDYLHTHYGEKLTLESLSDQLFVSKTALAYTFKKYTNCSIVDFLLNVRLTKAKELLVNTRKSMDSIAESCGFSSANYFSLIFKHKEGVSPTQYRKNQLAKR